MESADDWKVQFDVNDEGVSVKERQFPSEIAVVSGQVQPAEFDSLIHSMVNEDLRAGTTYHAMKANNVKGRMKITGSGIIPEPKNVVDALMGDRHHTDGGRSPQFRLA